MSNVKTIIRKDDNIYDELLAERLINIGGNSVLDKKRLSKKSGKYTYYFKYINERDYDKALTEWLNITTGKPADYKYKPDDIADCNTENAINAEYFIYRGEE